MAGAADASMLRKIIITGLLLIGGSPFANQKPQNGNDFSSEEEICDYLLQSVNSGIFSSPNGVQRPSPNQTRYFTSFPKFSRPLADVLVILPFGKTLIDEVPLLRKLAWEGLNERAFTENTSVFGNPVGIWADTRGLIDIKVGASLDLNADRLLFQQIIRLLAKSGGEALLFAKSLSLPPHPEDGVQLWITRLDAGSKSGRAGLREILSFLLDIKATPNARNLRPRGADRPSSNPSLQRRPR